MKKNNVAHSLISPTNSVKKKVISLSLKANDNNPEQFWNSFLSALYFWDEEITKKFNLHYSEHLPNSAYFIFYFLEIIQQKPLLLLITNIQFISNTTILQFLNQLLQLEEANFTITLFTSDKKNDKNNILPISTRDRCYSPKEELMFYYDQGLLPSQNDFQTIRQFTNGWIPAIELILILHQEYKDLLLKQIETYIFNWFYYRFLTQYTEIEQECLFCLSLLEEFPEGLVKSISSHHEDFYHHILEDNPVIQYNPETNNFYFTDYLQPCLKEKQKKISTEKKHQFYKFAARWFNDHNNKLKAIEYYQMTDAYDEIQQIMKQWLFPYPKEMVAYYIDTINAMSTTYLKRQPLFYVIHGYLLCTLYRYKEAYTLMKNFCLENEQNIKSPPQITNILGEAYLLWANICIYTGQEAAVPSLLKRAIKLLPNGSQIITKHTNSNFLSDTPVLRLPNPEAGSLAQNVEYITTIEPYLNKITHGGWSGASYLAQAEMNYYINNFKDVEFNAHKAMAIALENKQYELACCAAFLIMRFHFAKGNYHSTIHNLKLIKNYTMKEDYNVFFSLLDIAENWLVLKLGKIQETSYWIQDNCTYQKAIIPWNYGRDRIIRALYLMHSQQYQEAISFAESTIEIFKERYNNLLIIHLYMIQCICYSQLKKHEKAMITFELAYLWSYNNHITMPIIECGAAVSPLIHCYKSSTRTLIPENWLDQIAAQTHNYAICQDKMKKKYEKERFYSSNILSKLTITEQQLLLKNCQGLSAKELARLHNKTYETIHSTLEQIYIKINAHSKADAIRIVTENDLI